MHLKKNNASLAQFGRAIDLYSMGRGFDAYTGLTGKS